MRGLFFGGAIVGVLLGLGLGLGIAWYIWPISLSEADPADLRLDIKDDYLRMIATSYGLDGDMARALQRIGILGLSQPETSIADLIRRESAPLYQQALIRLALDLKKPSVALARPTYTPRPTKTRLMGRVPPTDATRPPATNAKPVPSLPPSAATPELTAIPPTSVPNPDAPHYILSSKSSLTCYDTRGRGVIEISVEDANGKPLPGVGVEVNWSAGDEIFYTGLKPERGMGYADTEVAPGSYSLRLAENAQSPVIENLQVDDQPETCTGEAPQVRGWKLVFRETHY